MSELRDRASGRRAVLRGLRYASGDGREVRAGGRGGGAEGAEEREGEASADGGALCCRIGGARGGVLGGMDVAPGPSRAEPPEAPAGGAKVERPALGERSSPFRTPSKPGSLGHAPKKTGDEGYLEIVVYQPSRTEDKMALISVRRSIDAYKAVEGGLPASLKELYDAHPFEPAPAGTE